MGKAYPSCTSLLVERPLEKVVSLVFNRPERKNALDRELVLAIGDALDAANDDQSARVIVLSGVGGAFCSGADLTTIREAKAEEIPGRIDEFHRMITSIVDSNKPVVAAVGGPAVGFGADLCLACDVRIFDESGYLEEGFVKIGLMPDGGGTHQLQRYVGPRAFEMLALGTRLDAATCLHLGIANHVVKAPDLAAMARQVAEKLAGAAPLAVAEIKRSLRAGHGDALRAALAREKAGQGRLLLSADFAEGVEAFLSKRPPRFSGK